MKAILQHDERDCGAACLAMIAEHYGYTQSLNFYRDLTHTDQSGASAYEIVQAAASIGFSAEALSGRIEDLQNGLKEGEIKLPFIAHVTTEDHSRHFVVVSAVSKRKMHICDPAKGKIVESPDDFARRWTGNIICFEKNETAENSV